VRVIVFWTVDHPFFKRRIFILGEGPLAEAVKSFIRVDGSAHLRCVGHTGRKGTDWNSGLTIGNLALRLHPDASPISLPELAETTRAEEIVVATDDRRGLPFAELLECRLRGVQVTDYDRHRPHRSGNAGIRRRISRQLCTAPCQTRPRHRRRIGILDVSGAAVRHRGDPRQTR